MKWKPRSSLRRQCSVLYMLRSVSSCQVAADGLKMRSKYSPCTMGKTRLSLPVIQFQASKINRWWSTDVLVFLTSAEDKTAPQRRSKRVRHMTNFSPKNKTKNLEFLCFRCRMIRLHCVTTLRCEWRRKWIQRGRCARRRVAGTQEEGSSSCRSSSSPSLGPSPVLAFLKRDKKNHKHGSQLLWSFEVGQQQRGNYLNADTTKPAN